MFAGFWLWAIWICAEHWRENPNYSYGWVVPPLALGFGLRRSWKSPARAPSRPGLQDFSAPLTILVAIGCGAIIFWLEFARQQMWRPQWVLSLICFLAIASSFIVFRLRAGPALARAEMFPVLFFLTAVPWPARLEQPITSTLIRWVARTTVELLHWLGIEAQRSGGAIALRDGLVGVTEACSGVRSLQAGIMFGLAMGEWFLLRPARRVALLGIAILLALATNLARTVALSLQAEWHGIESVERVHDMMGNSVVTALIFGIWLAGKYLSPRALEASQFAGHDFGKNAREFLRRISAPAQPAFRAIVLVSLVAFVCARVTYGRIEMADRTQTAPSFVTITNASKGDRLVPVPRTIWDELRPTSGEYLRRENAELPRGAADFYHFFWKPSPWNRFALVHRPDICMPGVGWETAGSPEPLEIALEGGTVRCHAFRFRRGDYFALQLWGVWRNGDPVPLDYEPAQVLGAALPPPSMHLEGKRRSATEIIACTLIAEGAEPSKELAMALLRSVFHYQPR